MNQHNCSFRALLVPGRKMMQGFISSLYQAHPRGNCTVTPRYRGPEACCGFQSDLTLSLWLRRNITYSNHRFVLAASGFIETHHDGCWHLLSQTGRPHDHGLEGRPDMRFIAQGGHRSERTRCCLPSAFLIINRTETWAFAEKKSIPVTVGCLPTCLRPFWLFFCLFGRPALFHITQPTADFRNTLSHLDIGGSLSPQSLLH